MRELDIIIKSAGDWTKFKTEMAKRLSELTDIDDAAGNERTLSEMFGET